MDNRWLSPKPACLPLLQLFLLAFSMLPIHMPCPAFGGESAGFSPGRGVWFYSTILLVCLLAILITMSKMMRLKSENRKRKRAEKGYLQHLQFVRNMELVDSVIQKSDDVEVMLQKAIETVHQIYRSNRAWLLFPCNPDVQACRVLVESCDAAYPGSHNSGRDVTVNKAISEGFRVILAKDNPVVSDPNHKDPRLTYTAQEYGVQSKMVMALRPQTGDAWLFGIHQCDFARVWTDDEQILFKRIGRRLTDALSNLLFLQQLKESEKRLRQLTEAAWEGIVIHDQGTLLQANKQFYEMFEFRSDELVGRHMFDYIATARSRDFMLEQIEQGNLGPYETIGRRKNGSTFPMEVRVKLMDYGGKTVRVGAIRDISDRKRAEAEHRALEEKLIRSKKMEAMGLMAGGVAHDLNNILSGVVGYPDMLLLSKGLDPAVRQGLEAIKKSGERAAAVVSDLLTVARGIAVDKQTLNLNHVVEEYLGSPEHGRLEQDFPDITVGTALTSDLLNIKGSLIHMKKAVMNLVSNAMEAIGGRGRVCISTANRYLDRPLGGYDRIQVGEYAVLSISDNGPGIRKEDLDRIFEPFYTRKVMGRSGTGLGLAVVWNIVQDFEGYINVASDNSGTTFELYFPVSRTRIHQEAAAFPTDKLRGCGETILVVDDEASQRDMTVRMLTALGYTVEAAAGGEQAVARIREKRVDLVVLDMIMPPGIDGCETYARMKAVNPGQNAIIASGFAETEDVKKAQRMGAGQFVRKPFTMEKLGLAVKAALAPGQEGGIGK